MNLMFSIQRLICNPRKVLTMLWVIFRYTLLDINFYKSIFCSVCDEEIANDSFEKYIVVGTNCIPRYFFTIAGVKPSKEQGEKSMPFDLAAYINLFMISYFLRNDFKHFFEDIKFYSDSMRFVRKNIVEFNHDQDLNGDYEKFVIRYKNRIENFKEAVNFERNVLFIVSSEIRNSEFALKVMYNALKFIRKGKPFGFLIIDLGKSQKSDFTFKDMNNIHIIKSPIPYESYIWHDSKHRETEQGKMFDKKLLDEIKMFENVKKS